MTDPEGLAGQQTAFRRFVHELNRRRVARTAAIYTVAGLAVIEFANNVFPVFDIPLVLERLLIAAGIIGFPLALLLAWTFQVTDGQVHRRPVLERSAAVAAYATATLGGLLVLTAVVTAVAWMRVGTETPIALPVPDTVVVTDTILVGLAPGESGVVVAPPEIRIREPAVWSEDTTEAAMIPDGGELGFEGVVLNRVPIREVLLNGRRLRLASGPEGGVVFSGTLRPTDARFGDVVIVLRAADGGVHFVSYPVRVEGVAVAAETAAPLPPMVAPGAPTAAAKVDTARVFAPAPVRQRWAVILGLSEYADPRIAAARFADDDAMAVYDFLRSPAAGMGGIPEDHIRLLVNEEATGRNISSTLATFLRASTPDDVILLYMAGRGLSDPQHPGSQYLLAYDTDRDDLSRTAIPSETINDALRNAYAYQKILFVDLNRSTKLPAGGGAAIPTAGPEDSPARARSGTMVEVETGQVNAAFLEYVDKSSGGFVAFAGSESDQFAWEGEQWGGGHGIFTYYVVQGLRGAADAVANGGDGDRVVTLGEVMEYTRDRVRRETRNAQVPTISQTIFDRFWPMAAVINP